LPTTLLELTSSYDIVYKWFDGRIGEFDVTNYKELMHVDLSK